MKTISILLLLAGQAVWAQETPSLNVDAMKQDLADVQRAQAGGADKKKACDKIKSNLLEFHRHKTDTQRDISNFKCDSAPLAPHADWCKMQLDTMRLIDFGISEAETGIRNGCTAAG